MMIFNELRKHGRLAAKRQPMYEKNKVAKILGYVMGAFWAGYLIFFGTTFAFGFSDMVPNREPYHVMNAVVLIFILALDFLLRVPLQKTPTQEVKPYLLLPVKRIRVIEIFTDPLGTKSVQPVLVVSVCSFFLHDYYQVFRYLRCYHLSYRYPAINYCQQLLVFALPHSYQRTYLVDFITYRFLRWIGCLLFIPEDSPLFYFFMDLGDGYIQGNIFYFLGTILVIVLLWLINRKIMSGLIYAELAKVDDTQIKHVSEYKFFERYGEVGEYMRLELKMLLRNRRCKGALRNISIVIVAFSVALSFSSVYDGNFMTSFICVYNFAVFGMIILSQIMSFEGNYIDGLMSRKESIMSLLKAKYYTYSIGEIIPFILMIPAIIMNKLTLLGAFAWFFYTIGFIYFCFFQLAVYNKQTVPLNEKVTSRQKQ